MVVICGFLLLWSSSGQDTFCQPFQSIFGTKKKNTKQYIQTQTKWFSIQVMNKKTKTNKNNKKLT